MELGKEIVSIKLDDIVPNPYQPRIKFDEQSLNELAMSIKTYGIIEPLLVRKENETYEIIAGERRYKAAQIAGLNEVPCVIVDVDNKTSAQIALIENLQRKDLTSIEEARAYQKILEITDNNQENLANKIGKSQDSITSKLNLLTLPDEVQDALLRNAISERHARSLLKLEDKSQQLELLDKISKERLSVKQTEDYIKNLSSIVKNSDKPNEVVKSKNVISLDDLSDDMLLHDPIVIENNNHLESQDNIKKEEINMNQEQNNVMPNNTAPIPNEAPKFFPSIENEAANMNFEQPQMVSQPTMPTQPETVTPIPAIEPVQVVEPAQTTPISQPTDVTPIQPEVNPQPTPTVDVSMPNQVAQPTMMPSSEPVAATQPQQEVIQPDLSVQPQPTTTNMNVAITTIRNAISSVEASGYVLTTQELDLEGEYQIIIKIQK